MKQQKGRRRRRRRQQKQQGRLLWSRIINDDKNALHNLLPSKLNRPLRRRGHDFELPIGNC